jgi:hypothetical protein
MPPTPKAGDFTPDGLAVLRGMLAAWLYTTVSQLANVKAATNTSTIVTKLCSDLTALGLQVNQYDVKSYVTAVRSDASPASLSDALVNSNAVAQITVYTDPGGGAAPVPGPMDAWTGGGHPSPADLIAAFVGSQA